MPKQITIEMSDEENEAVKARSSMLGTSKRRFVHDMFRAQMIRKGLVIQTAVDTERGITK